MSDIIYKTKQLITHEPREEAIRELIKLQKQTSEKERHIPRLACLSLMEMNHDWQGIRKLIVAWRLVIKFGSSLVKRMRKRVNEDEGVVSQEQQYILSQLDRLNDKNWKQYSPKRNLPDYSDLIAEDDKKDLRHQPENEPKLEKAQSKQKRSSELDTNRLSKVLQTKIQEKGSKQSKQKQIMTRGVFSKQFAPKIQSTADRNQTKNERSRETGNLQAMKKNQNSNSHSNSNSKSHSNSNSKLILKRNENLLPKLTTPSKQAPKKIISLKYANNEKDKIKQESFKDQFSFSAVKAKQVQALSNNKVSNTNRNDELNDSFLNFAQESRQPKDMNGKNEDRDNFQEQFCLEKQLAKTSHRSKPIKIIFSQQQLALIEPQVAAKNFLQNIMIAENKTGISMLKSRLGIK